MPPVLPFSRLSFDRSSLQDPREIHAANLPASLATAGFALGLAADTGPPIRPARNSRGDADGHAPQMTADSTTRYLAYKIHTDIGDTFHFTLDARSKMRFGEKHEPEVGDVIKIVSTKWWVRRRPGRMIQGWGDLRRSQF